MVVTTEGMTMRANHWSTSGRLVAVAGTALMGSLERSDDGAKNETGSSRRCLEHGRSPFNDPSRAAEEAGD